MGMVWRHELCQGVLALDLEGELERIYLPRRHYPSRFTGDGQEGVERATWAIGKGDSHRPQTTNQMQLNRPAIDQQVFSRKRL